MGEDQRAPGDIASLVEQHIERVKRAVRILEREQLLASAIPLRVVPRRRRLPEEHLVVAHVEPGLGDDRERVAVLRYAGGRVPVGNDHDTVAVSLWGDIRAEDGVRRGGGVQPVPVADVLGDKGRVLYAC
ncbi:hypothetical protein CALVIDRAFT_398200 [Calocera viscosa TUFC12733]|uniref:Uncharacterized protein n=1 Tax=Calocera viscosa (strain TUFC12733) TaxID=1330018 RepID=A0A167PRK5_CALVF|nr:hypothetical protein CALVIDRAFT_398200 [Calocera viscosa TUFC12733]